MSSNGHAKLIHRSIAVLAILLVLGFGSAILRLTQRSVGQGEELSHKAVNQQRFCGNGVMWRRRKWESGYLQQGDLLIKR